MEPTLTRAPAAPPRRRIDIAFILGIGALVGAFFVAARLVAAPSFVDRVRIENPSNALLDVDVTSDNHDGWLPIAIARGDATTTTHDVVDQGDVWIFRFRSAGRDGGELRISRAQLARQHWTITVPARVSATLGNEASEGG